VVCEPQEALHARYTNTEADARLQVSYLSYRDTRPRWERTQLAYVSAGYIWRSAMGLECQLGGGAMFVVSDDSVHSEQSLQFVLWLPA
jgi:hypothetical protein